MTVDLQGPQSLARLAQDVREEQFSFLGLRV